jgi:DNA-binding transcriptional ArsR family regulator
VLASEAAVSAQAASGQLARLVQAGLLEVERTGRNRYYRLATGHVGEARTCYDLISTQMPEHSYVLGSAAAEVFGHLGVPAEALADGRSRRPLLRFCMDWSEQCHHLAGRLGALLCAAFFDAEWITRTPVRRAIRLTEQGRHELHARLGLVARKSALSQLGQ